LRNLLIDNSTITAVDRILGNIPLNNYYQVDGDIAAFESFIQGILFSDKLISLADYKPNLTPGRVERYPFIDLIPPQSFEYDHLAEGARRIVENISPIVKQSKLDDHDFGPFIELLKANLAFSWRFHSSVYWLTVSMLTQNYGNEVNRYSRLWELIIGQLRESEQSSSASVDMAILRLHERAGTIRSISDLRNREGVERTVRTFLGSLSWLAFRTCFYSILSQSMGVDVVLHPIRHAFRANMLHRHMGLRPDVYASILGAMNDKIRATTTEVLAYTQPIVSRIELPLFSATLVERTGDVRRVIAAALELRSDKRFREARAQLMELESLSQKNYVKTANKIITGLDRTADILRSEFSISGRQGVHTGPIIAVAGAVLKPLYGLDFPNIDIRLPVPKAVTRRIGNRGFRGIFRSIVEDLTAIERLGNTRTKLAKAVDRTDARRDRVPREDPRWFGVDSSVRRWV
jgi:hypothetical protein